MFNNWSQFPVAISVERNSSGHVISMDGVSPRMLEWLSTRFEFSYVYFVCEYTTAIKCSTSISYIYF
jgi:hypothetical protein